MKRKILEEQKVVQWLSFDECQKLFKKSAKGTQLILDSFDEIIEKKRIDIAIFYCSVSIQFVVDAINKFHRKKDEIFYQCIAKTVIKKLNEIKKTRSVR